jgi:hypothetical protein
MMNIRMRRHIPVDGGGLGGEGGEGPSFDRTSPEMATTTTTTMEAMAMASAGMANQNSSFPSSSSSPSSFLLNALSSTMANHSNHQRNTTAEWMATDMAMDGMMGHDYDDQQMDSMVNHIFKMDIF